MAGVWAIDGVEVPASVARVLAYVAGGGTAGIIEPGSFWVRSLAVPGPSVRVMPGAAAVANTYPGGGLQCYPVFEDTQQTIAVDATSSSAGRRDLVVVRVYDPEYQTIPAGKKPGAWFEIIKGVPDATVRSRSAAEAYCRTLNYPCEPLAGIDIPPSTATITSGMILNLRELAQPRMRQEVITRNLTGSESYTLNHSTSLTAFPGASTFDVEIPRWATHVSLVATWNQVYFVTGGGTANIRGLVRAVLGGISDFDQGRFDSGDGVGSYRTVLRHACKPVPVPEAIRGTTQQFTFNASVDFVGQGAAMTMDANSSVDAVLTFTEQAI